METSSYRGFGIFKVKPCRKTIYRIYKDGVFKQTTYSMVDAKRLVDFCVDAGVWK